WPCTACSRPCTAPPTKDATCSCEPRLAGRNRRRAARGQLPSLSTSAAELRRRRAGDRPGAAAGAAERRARRAALGIRVRLRDSGCGLVLAGGGAVALHAVVGPRLPRHHRHLRAVARPGVLVRAAGSPALS